MMFLLILLLTVGSNLVQLLIIARNHALGGYLLHQQNDDENTVVIISPPPSSSSALLTMKTMTTSQSNITIPKTTTTTTTGAGINQTEEQNQQQKVSPTKRRESTRSQITANSSNSTASNITTSLSAIETKSSNKNNVPANAVLHIGPYKTASTSIQSSSRLFMSHLAKDGYEMPWVKIRSTANQVPLAICFRYQPFTHPVLYCDERLLEEGRNIAMRNNSILISAEDFSSHDVNLTHVEEYLHQWNHVTVVYVYRRLYTWLQSYHNQISRYIKIDSFRANNTDNVRMNITDFIDQELSRNMTQYITGYYESIKRYKAHGGIDKLVILNMEDKTTDITQQFFCHAMPHAENTCNKAKRSVDKKRSRNDNRSMPLVYYDLAYGAHRLGMINITSQKQLDSAVQLIENHQRVTLNRSSDVEFPFVVCPDRPVLDKLLEISLGMEEWMVPEFFSSPFGESKLRADFEQQAKLANLCSVDISATVRSNEWVNFLSSLNKNIHNSTRF
jgi:hypothetical protein